VLVVNQDYGDTDLLEERHVERAYTGGGDDNPVDTPLPQAFDQVNLVDRVGVRSAQEKPIIVVGRDFSMPRNISPANGSVNAVTMTPTVRVC